MGEASDRVFDVPIIKEKGGAKTSLTANLRTLESSVKELRLTPIIGTESSVIGRESTMPWQRMSAEMNRALFDLQDTVERNYLTSLMLAKGIPVTKQPGRAQSATDELAALRRELVRLASRATGIFAQEMLDEAVTDALAFKIDVRQERDIAALDERLVTACLAALEQGKASQHPGVRRSRIGFDETEVYSRLLDLTFKFMGGQIPAVSEGPFWVLRNSVGNREHVNEMQRDLRNRTVTKECRHQVFLHQLEWLADLIFYSFSFDGGFYPTSDELSFRAALHIGEGDRRPASVNVFEKGGDALVEIAPAWIRQYQADDECRSGQMKDFYDALALILLSQDKYWAGRIANAKLRREPVAFSLNLDLEMEKALERVEVLKYSVAIPVQAITAEPDEQIHQRWLLAKFLKGEKYQCPTWAWYSYDSGMSAEIDGPLVVKLHGSPLHQLPSPVSREEFDDKKNGGMDPSVECIAPPPSESVCYSSIKHSVTLSESGYLQNLVVVRNMPEFFVQVMGDRQRHFYFLGLSTSEWNMRLRMSGLVFPTSGQGAGRRYSPGRLMVAVNKEFDDYRSSILDSIGIKRWEGALEGLTADLLRWAKALQ